MGFVLADKINQAINQNGFVGAIVYGGQRLGKSSYALKTAYQIYGDWDKVNECVLYKLSDVVKVIKDAINGGYKVPCIIWDDAGVHANRLLYFAERDLVRYLENMLDVIGTHVSSLILTTPNPLNLLLAIRGFEFYRIKVYRKDAYNGRYAVGYNSVLLPSGTRLIRREFSDNYNVRLPDDFYAKYMIKRNGYLKDAINQLESIGKQMGSGGEGVLCENKVDRDERTSEVAAVIG